MEWKYVVDDDDDSKNPQYPEDDDEEEDAIDRRNYPENYAQPGIVPFLNPGKMSENIQNEFANGVNEHKQNNPFGKNQYLEGVKGMLEENSKQYPNHPAQQQGGLTKIWRQPNFGGEGIYNQDSVLPKVPPRHRYAEEEPNNFVAAHQQMAHQMARQKGNSCDSWCHSHILCSTAIIG